MRLNHDAYQLIITVSLLNGHDDSLTNNLKGGEVHGDNYVSGNIIFLQYPQYVEDIVDYCPIDS